MWLQGRAEGSEMKEENNETAQHCREPDDWWTQKAAAQEEASAKMHVQVENSWRKLQVSEVTSPGHKWLIITTGAPAHEQEPQM